MPHTSLRIITILLLTTTSLLHTMQPKWEQLKDMPPVVQQWAQKTIKEHGIKDTNWISFKMGDAWQWRTYHGIIADEKDIKAIYPHLQRKQLGHYNLPSYDAHYYPPHDYDKGEIMTLHVKQKLINIVLDYEKNND